MTDDRRCYFCGSAAVGVILSAQPGNVVAWVQCQSCHARGPIGQTAALAWRAWTKAEGDG